MTLVDSLLAMGVGVVLLVGGAEALVRGAAALALRFGITPLVVGLTVVAFGTSSPELVVSVQAALSGNGPVALGNVIGSNVANLGLIVGVSAALSPLAVDRQLLTRDVPVMIVSMLALWGLAAAGSHRGAHSASGARCLLLLLTLSPGMSPTPLASGGIRPPFPGCSPSIR